MKSLRPFTSPTLNCESTDENDENEKIAEDHDGVHDTITSLAGAEMLQRYRRAMSGSGSHKDSSSSISQVLRLREGSISLNLFRYIYACIVLLA